MGQKLTLLPQDKSIFFMRWMRMHLEAIEKERAVQI